MQEQHIIQICAERGLNVREVRTQAGLLQLVPESLEHLPSADILGEIADAVASVSDTRWVTLLLEEDS